MMRKLFLVIGILAVLTPALLAQTVDEIIAKNVEARGGLDKIKSVQSIKITGHMAMGPMEAPITMIQKRPNQMRMEFTVQGLTGVRAYDGTSGWAIMPFTGKKDPEAMTADDVKEMQDQADIDGPLVDYKAKGNQVEFLGKDKIEGTDAYKLKVTRKNGDIDTLYIDTDSGLEIKEDGKRMVRGSEQEFETSIGDYREVSGLMFPFAIESNVKGSAEKQKITIDKVEINVPADASTFKMPEVAPAPPAKPDEKKAMPKP
jgi:outer membrane lipoprotein-sorting protein